MGTKGYHSYRGRRGGLRLLMIVLLVLILLAACAYLFLQRYVTFTDSGEVRLDLPFFQKEEGTSADKGENEPDSGEMNLVIGETGEDGQEDADQTAAPYGEHRLISLSALPADGAVLEEELSAQGANGYVFTVKDNTGKVFYDSTVALRDAVDENGADPALIRTLCQQEGTISVARLCQSSGYIWYDNLSYYWLDPAKEQARDYIIDLALECARLGFDELLLEEVTYPSSGKLEKIDYSGNELDKVQALTLFLTELREALEPYDIRIALLVEEDALLAETTGQDMKQLLPLVDAVYVQTSDVEAAEAAVAGAAPEKTPALVPVTEEVLAAGNWYIS